MGQVPQLARASVLEHDGIRAVVMATGRVEHIPGGFVQFFHLENEEVSLCWKIVRSEMYCTRIGVMFDNIGCTKNKASSKQFCLHQCTAHSRCFRTILPCGK